MQERTMLYGSLNVGAAVSDGSVEGDVEIADGGDDEGVLEAYLVCEMTFREGDEGSADDGCDHEGRPPAGEFSQAAETEGEDIGEHDGVEEADEDDAAHGEVSVGEHRDDDQQRGGTGDEGEQRAGADAGEDGGADETAGHGSSPVERDEEGRSLFREVADVVEAEVVDEEAADGDFGSYVDEDADGSHDEVLLRPDAARVGGEFAGAEVAGVGGFRGELDERDGDGEEDEGEGDAKVRHSHGGCLLLAVALEERGGEGVEL